MEKPVEASVSQTYTDTEVRLADPNRLAYSTGKLRIIARGWSQPQLEVSWCDHAPWRILYRIPSAPAEGLKPARFRGAGSGEPFIDWCGGGDQRGQPQNSHAQRSESACGVAKVPRDLAGQ